jgi:tripartite ATP-independent transporter DctM subunit
VQFVVWRNPAAGPRGERLNWPERMIALKGVWGTMILFGIVMGGIYGGVFTPTEAAGIGAGGALLIALSRRALSWRALFDTLAETARTSATLFTVLIGALIFSSFVNRAGLPDGLRDLVSSFDVAPMVVIVLILAVYIVLGCVFESLSMLLLTIPVFFPLVESFGFHPVWFGIVVVVVTEISLITPPVGLNVFVLSGVLRDVSTSTVFKGVTPFWCADILRLALLVMVPVLSLFLPNLLYH